ncbi:MAG: hypothetical protein RIS47_1466 [Bacteroidota bacterium]|jgi:mannose-6-phosphate isomerase
MSSLYPLKFRPIFKEKIWGGKKLHSILNKHTDPQANIGESWEISAVEGNISVVANGFLEGNDLQELAEIYMGDLVGDKVFDFFGDEFPLLIKLIDASDKLSIQVHPNDEVAAKRHNSYGKTEMWYVLQADPGAKLVSGFNKQTDKTEYLAHLENGTVETLMNAVEVEPNDVFFVNPGRVHAIGKGIVLAEIQQTSDITYRIFDYNRLENGQARELHTELAVDVLDYTYNKDVKTNVRPKPNETLELASCPYFTTSIIAAHNPIEKDYNEIDSFVIYMVIEGSIQIVTQEQTTQVAKGETVLIPAEIKNLQIIPITEAKIIEVYIK